MYLNLNLLLPKRKTLEEKGKMTSCTFPLIICRVSFLNPLWIPDPQRSDSEWNNTLRRETLGLWSKCVHDGSQLLGRQLWPLDEFLACNCPACRWLPDEPVFRAATRTPKALTPAGAHTDTGRSKRKEKKKKHNGRRESLAKHRQGKLFLDSRIPLVTKLHASDYFCLKCKGPCLCQQSSK